ncbi:YbfB/YjiJ family MFS transporter, partial [Escherichia coli]|nr:YbfB/YjiJ family MFS transporter [Escherichia coli]
MVEWLRWDQQWLGLGLLGAALFVPAWRWLPPPVVTQADGRALPASTVAPPAARWTGLLMATYFCAGFGYVIS